MQKKIQTAILPELHTIKKVIPDFFVLYLPKDIVSGDFYSFIQKDDELMIAVADCTGHGVSGAFMSMICSSLLNQVVNDRKMMDPALVLEELNKEIIQALKQRSGESHDGMDLALCNINLKENMLSFSGANRSLWLIRDHKLHEFKADKMPIGGLQFIHKDIYKSHTVHLLKGDALYLSTDGYADQFGGVRGKKLMTKKFKDLLISIHHFPMSEQEKYLLEYFYSWKKGEEQVDDVLVMGFRL